MRIRTTRLSILAAIPVTLAVLGCNSTQPDQITTQSASLSVSAKALVDTYDCYDAWLDTDGNGVADTDTGAVLCYGTGGKQDRPVPWHYSIEVSMIRAGHTDQELIGSSVVPGDGIQDFISMTAYDETVENAASRPPEGNLFFLNGTRVSTGNQIYLTSANVMADLGPSNVLGQTPTFDFDINPGDTVIVQARKQPDGDGPPSVSFETNPELTISGILTIAGVQVQVNGESISQDADKAGISFSYTRQ